MSLLADEDIILDNMDWMTTYMSKFNIKCICMNDHGWGKSLLSTEPSLEHGMKLFTDKKLNELNVDLDVLEKVCPIMTGNLNNRQRSRFSKDIKLKIYRVCETICKYYFEKGQGMKVYNPDPGIAVYQIDEYIMGLMRAGRDTKVQVMFRNRRRFNWMMVNIFITSKDNILDDFSIIFDCR